MVLAGVGHQDRIGQDHGIDAGAGAGGAVDRALPGFPVARLWIGVQRQQHLVATLVRIGDAGAERGVGEVEAGEIARIGRVAKTQVDAVGAIVDRALECGQAAGRANEFEWYGQWRGSGW